jgi:hypothetical protein
MSSGWRGCGQYRIVGQGFSQTGSKYGCSGRIGKTGTIDQNVGHCNFGVVIVRYQTCQVLSVYF